MRTAKTLLIAAAALAATITASQAQTVYSQNVVGYINVTVTNGTLALAANQLDTGSNTVNNVLQAGLVSGKVSLLEWNGTGYNQYIYYNCADSPSSQSGWYIGNVLAGATNYIQPGYGFFLHNTASASITLPTVGQVIQGTNQYSIPVGLNIYSLPEALAGLPLDNTNINFPAVSGKTAYLTWNGAGFNQYIYYNCADSPASMSGWYGGNTFEDTNTSIWPVAGQSFFIHNTSSGTLTWTNVFQVQ